MQKKVTYAPNTYVTLLYLTLIALVFSGRPATV